MSYILVTEGGFKSLEESVNKMIGEGYTPIGGPYAVPVKREHDTVIRYRHTQAMIRIESK